jgi:hypothetical protein
MKTTVSIKSLSAWALPLDKSKLRDRLPKRGKEFWSCRHRRLVSYDAPAPTIFELQTVSHPFAGRWNNSMLAVSAERERPECLLWPSNGSSGCPPDQRFGLQDLDLVSFPSLEERPFRYRRCLTKNKRRKTMALELFAGDNDKILCVLD